MKDENSAHLRSGRIAKVGNNIVADYQVLHIGSANGPIAEPEYCGVVLERGDDVLQ